jgi:hypothetical protein
MMFSVTTLPSYGLKSGVVEIKKDTVLKAIDVAIGVCQVSSQTL